MEVKALTRMLALLSSILLTLTTAPVQARVKCGGRYNSQACHGGNGKRSMPSSNYPPTLASRLREARNLALQSALQSGYGAPNTASLLARLQPDVPTKTSRSFSEKLLARDLANWLQEDSSPRQDEVEPILDRRSNGEQDDFSVSDVMSDEMDMTPDDMETVRDIFTALTLRRALGTDGVRAGNRDPRDDML